MNGPRNLYLHFVLKNIKHAQQHCQKETCVKYAILIQKRGNYFSSACHSEITFCNSL